jgi:hypothetical protein
MKNIYLIATDKASRLSIKDSNNKLELGEKNTIFVNGFGFTPQNIYITSDEEIKEEDWFIANQKAHKCIRVDSNTSCPFITLNNKGEEIGHFHTWKTKIILTTDQSLDGVQEIDNEFLEWFCKNPSCEEVFIANDFEQVNQDNPILRGSTNVVHKYKIIIPKEEPKMIDDWLAEHGDPEIYKNVKKQLELEEAAINFYREFPSNPLDKPEWHYNRDVDCFKKRKAFINGAKYMAERMYSEEEIRKSLLDIVLVNPAHITMLKSGYGEFPDTYELTEKGVDYIIEQFKKK